MTTTTRKNVWKQCPYCIYRRLGDVRLARHIQSAHPDKVEEWIHLPPSDQWLKSKLVEIRRKFLSHGEQK